MRRKLSSACLSFLAFLGICEWSVEVLALPSLSPRSEQMDKTRGIISSQNNIPVIKSTKYSNLRLSYSSFLQIASSSGQNNSVKRYNYSSACNNDIVVNSLDEPIPKTRKELDGQGINGLILIVGIACAILFASGKRPNLRRDKSGKDKDYS